MVSGTPPNQPQEGKQGPPEGVRTSGAEMVTGWFSNWRDSTVHGGCSDAAFQQTLKGRSGTHVDGPWKQESYLW